MMIKIIKSDSIHKCKYTYLNSYEVIFEQFYTPCNIMLDIQMYFQMIDFGMQLND